MQREEKVYKISEGDLDKILDLIPRDPSWNYLRMVLEPEIHPADNIYGTIKMTRGTMSAEFERRVHDYSMSTTNILHGRPAGWVRWRRVKIIEHEPHWINKALDWYSLVRRDYIVFGYRLTELKFLRGAFHRVEDRDREPSGFNIRVEGSSENLIIERREIIRGERHQDNLLKEFADLVNLLERLISSNQESNKAS